MGGGQFGMMVFAITTDTSGKRIYKQVSFVGMVDFDPNAGVAKLTFGW